MPLLQELAIGTHFASVTHPRIERSKDHALLDISIITICAVVCGAEGWVAVEEFGKSNREWLSRFLDLPAGIPSHDTFGRVFARIDPEQFQHCFLSWLRAMQVRRPDVIAIDGKTHRGSHDRSTGKPMLHLVRAWATENRLVLGHVAVDEKSNEITAIPALLELLDLRGSTVTIDALGCQSAITEQIVARGGNYVLALKGNHRRLYADVSALFADGRAAKQPGYGMTSASATERGHGRSETRRACVIREPKVVS